jgi:hypothetical protein
MRRLVGVKMERAIGGCKEIDRPWGSSVGKWTAADGGIRLDRGGPSYPQRATRIL